MVGQLDTIEAQLGSDPPLTGAQKRHAAKLRKGGDKVLPQIGSLVQQQELESPALPVSDMTALLGKAAALQPLVNRVAAFGKHVDDVIFKAESDALVIAQQYYALLQRRALTDTELAAALQPIAAFFAFRHRTPKAPGTPTKRQRKATTKAVATLKKTAPEKLAPQETAAAPAAAPATGAPTPGAGNTTPTHS